MILRNSGHVQFDISMAGRGNHMMERIFDFAQRMGIRGTGIISTATRIARWCRRSVNYIRTVHINGVGIRIPSIYGISCEESESWMIDVLAKVLQKRPGAFLDVGMNVGQTLVKLKALDPHRDYVGFEPNPVCVAYVQELIKENNFVNCTVLPVGLYTEDRIMPMDLFSDSATDGRATLINNFRPDDKVYSRTFVPVLQFDSLANILGDKCAGIIKIDAEGAELEVVRSILELIRRDRPILLLEVLPVCSDKNTFLKGRQNELEGILSNIGYEILRVEKTASDTYRGLKRVVNIGIHSDLTQCDYVIVPGEQLSDF